MGDRPDPSNQGDVDSPSYTLAPAFSALYSRVQNRPPVESLISISPLLSIDPGETTGIAVFNHTDLEYADQLRTNPIEEGIRLLHQLVHTLQPKRVVVEDYRIYAWRTKQHTWAALHTPRLIGVIECLCYQYQIPIHKQSAQQGKGFVTDDRLREWNLYLPGRQHARDAIRHACQHLLFGDLPH